MSSIGKKNVALWMVYLINIESFDITARVQSFLPEYFQQHGYHSPVHPKNGPFQYAFGTDLSFFEFLHSQPKRAQTFNTYMTGNRSNRQHWLDWFPFHENVLRTWEERNDSKEMLLVDMGGGKGHDLKRLLEKYPEAKGRLVLEDLPGALQDFEDHGCSITTYAHDIFTPQPVKGSCTVLYARTVTDKDDRRRSLLHPFSFA